MQNLFLIIFLVFSATASAKNEFVSVYNAMALKSSESHSANGWGDVRKIKGFQWQWRFSDVAINDFTMVGKRQIGVIDSSAPYSGQTTLTISGVRSMIFKSHIEISNEGFLASGQTNLRNVFGKIKLQRIKTKCDIDEASIIDKYYKTEKIGYKPLYLNYIYSGGNGGDSTEYILAYDMESLLGNCE